MNLDVDISIHNTTCSEFAAYRGPGQKVIAYTYYEANVKQKKSFDAFNRDYFAGIESNLKLVNQMYGPEWVMRLYYQMPNKESQNWSKLCHLVCNNPQLDICDIEHNPKYGNISKVYPLVWRFLPALDATVETLLVRDLDSQISNREVAAVSEFLKSNKEFHVMRDHPYHGVAILGGTWGVKLSNSKVRQAFAKSFARMAKDPQSKAPRTKAGPDQVLLKRHVWPWAHSVAMSHDAYSCQEFSNSSPFPTQRQAGVGNFIGSVIAINNSIPFEPKFECPETCRPPEHQDWIYC